MSQLPVAAGLNQGFEPPRNTQFSVFLDNRVGKLLELLEVFTGQAVKVVALSINDSADHAVVRLITSRGELARRLLTRNKMAFSEKDILVVELNPEQSISTLCTALLSAEINIHYAYPLLVSPHRLPVVALQCDDIVLATQLLLRKRFLLLGENDLGDNATNSDETASEN